jgi:phosphoribosyl-dephospho-CoA transferase
LPPISRIAWPAVLPELPRHTLVWIDASAPWVALGGAPREHLRAWLDTGRPAVAARLLGDEPAGFVRLGVALPPSTGKQRLGFAVPRSAIKRVRDALTLREIADASPVEWQDAVRGLLDIASAISLEPRVYGSFAWQALTRERYVGPASDIDLAWRPRSAAQLDALTAGLVRWERSTGRRADGEVVLPSGDAVCWRELAGERARILVKSRSSVALRERSDFLAALA